MQRCRDVDARDVAYVYWTYSADFDLPPQTAALSRRHDAGRHSAADGLLGYAVIATHHLNTSDDSGRPLRRGRLLDHSIDAALTEVGESPAVWRDSGQDQLNLLTRPFEEALLRVLVSPAEHLSGNRNGPIRTGRSGVARRHAVNVVNTNLSPMIELSSAWDAESMLSQYVTMLAAREKVFQ